MLHQDQARPESWLFTDRHEWHRAVDHDWSNDVGTPAELHAALRVIAVLVAIATLAGIAILRCELTPDALHAFASSVEPLIRGPR